MKGGLSVRIDGEDRKVSRCSGCGSWCYGHQPCTTCGTGPASQ